MTVDLCRIRAVAASLRGIRERVTEHEGVHYWNTTPYDNAVGLLEDAIEGADFSSHRLDDDPDRPDRLPRPPRQPDRLSRSLRAAGTGKRECR